MNAKIQDIHLKRKAMVYLRQSTPRQVLVNRESTRRQYDLKGRAVALSWPEQLIEVIDQDLGRSGASTAGRAGFMYVSEQVAQGRVGAIFVLEVSRLSRSSADWHQLLELCAVADVVIVDEQAVYHPNDGDDRLMLGLKGAFSQAEREWMRRRMQGAKLAKAQRGELYTKPPVGYLWDAMSRRFIFDPDQQVQALVRHIFELFARHRSAGAVVRQIHTEKLEMCHRDGVSGELVFSGAQRGQILSLLHNPTYTGAYVYGRSKWVQRIVDGKLKRHREKLPIEQWQVLHRDHHPAYISWEEYMENQDQLRQNDNHPPEGTRTRSAARNGCALLQGLVLCGHCGRRMQMVYSSRDLSYYRCSWGVARGCVARDSWSISASVVDEGVERLILEAVSAEEVELSMQVASQAADQASEVDSQWRMKLERASYEARLAERRYKAVDPEMRLVARTLEEQWEHKLKIVRDLEFDYEKQRRQKRVELSAQDHERLDQLSADLREVWCAETTAMEDKKNLVRILVDQVSLHRDRNEVEISLQWATGAVDQWRVERRRAGPHSLSHTTARLIRDLIAEGRTSVQIVEHLNEAGLTTARGNSWTPARLDQWCLRNSVRRRGRNTTEPPTA